MSLQEKIDAYKAQSKAKTPPEKAALMAKATAELRTSGLLDTVLKAGDQAPDFSLRGATGQVVRLAELRQKGPVVVNFYRGLW